MCRCIHKTSKLGLFSSVGSRFKNDAARWHYLQIKRYFYFSLIAGFLLYSCSETKQGELPEIPVDIAQNTVSKLQLSEIAESIIAIDLELTDESPLNPKPISMKRIIVSEDMVFIAQPRAIFVFNMSGKFIRTIGSRGQGPGEYIYIRDFAFDKKNRRLFVNTEAKIICYDLEGNFIMESPMANLEFDTRIIDVNYVNNELLLITQHNILEEGKGVNFTILYRMNDKLQITDSITVRKTNDSPILSFSSTEDYILYLDSTVYLYYPYAVAPTPEERSDPFSMQRKPKTVLRDTLYRLENNQLVPELKLKFKNDGMGRDGYLFINLTYVFRSSRYIFAQYYNYLLDFDIYYPFFYFCYDTQTGKGYNTRDGFFDDFHQIEQVRIRPFHTNPEYFYYWHTHIKPDDREEPNPTLYIGKLKK